MTFKFFDSRALFKDANSGPECQAADNCVCLHFSIKYIHCSGEPATKSSLQQYKGGVDTKQQTITMRAPCGAENTILEDFVYFLLNEVEDIQTWLLD